MELVEGPTLAERIAQGPLRLDEAATIGRQIADALDYAHERGIVHRDLKPGNVKIRPDGVVKVLDFGLAKARPVAGVELGRARRRSPRHETAAGVIVGTFAYMAPEQLTGKTADRRADVWAFGCVFYEMLTGRMLHRGDSSQEVMASVLRDEPDLDQSPGAGAAAAEALSREGSTKALASHRRRDGAARRAAVGRVVGARQRRPPRRHARDARPGSGLPWPSLVLLAAGAAIVLWAPWRSQGQHRTGRPVRSARNRRAEVLLRRRDGRSHPTAAGWCSPPEARPASHAIGFVRSTASKPARSPAPKAPTCRWRGPPTAATCSSRVLGSPGLKKRGYPGWAAADRLEHRDGGLNGATANTDGAILVASNIPGPIFRVSASGDAPVAVTAVNTADRAHRFPQFLPDGRRFLYFVHTNDPQRSGVYVGALDVTPEAQSATRILASDRQAYYVASSRGGIGRLVFMRGTTLMTQPFDVDRLELSGEAAPIAERRRFLSSGVRTACSRSRTPTTAPSRSEAGRPRRSRRRSSTQSGRVLESFDLADAANPQVSPDGSHIAVAAGPPGAQDIWTIDIARKAKDAPDVQSGQRRQPGVVAGREIHRVRLQSWRRRGRCTSSRPTGPADERPADGSIGVPHELVARRTFPAVHQRVAEDASQDIWVLPDPGQPASESKPYARPRLARSNEGEAQFSPDGRWIAYESNESSPANVYVRPFSATAAAGGGAKWLISVGGGLNSSSLEQHRRTAVLRPGSTPSTCTPSISTRATDSAPARPRRLFAAPPPIEPE